MFFEFFETVCDILFLREDYKHYKKKKQRRGYEKTNNLPKKIMISSWTWAMIIFIVVMISLWGVKKFDLYYFGKNKTIKKLNIISEILEKEKNDIGFYPANLDTIKRNNPLRSNIDIDFWGNKYYYEKLSDSYILLSMGKDGTYNTKDDIKLKEN